MNGPASPRGRLFVIPAPSGAGKTTLVRALMEREPGLRFSISYTTRRQRPAEVDGRDYFFVDRASFEAIVAAGEFLEHARVFDNQYGTARSQVERSLAAGLDLILEIDWQGAGQVRRALPECISIFILPPSRPELERRLRGRGTDSEEVIQRRLTDAASDMTHWRAFGRFALIAAQSESDARGFRALGADPRSVRVTGSIKFDVALPASLRERSEVVPRLWGSARPVWVAGFSQHRAATALHDDLWAVAFVVDDGYIRLGLVGLDAIGLFHDDVLAVRRALQPDWRLHYTIVCTTHNHSTPDLMGLWGPDFSHTGVDPDYRRRVIAGSLAALGQAVAALGEARVAVHEIQGAGGSCQHQGVG